MALLMLGVFRPETDREAEAIGWLAIVVAGAGGVARAQQPAGTADAVRRRLRRRRLRPLHEGADARRLGRRAAAVVRLHARDASSQKFEYPVLVLLATAGMMMMISANDLIALYLGLELQSLALYVVAAIRRDDVRSSEAGLKYFVLGALSSGMLLYGASLIYGFTGSTSFAAIAAAAKAGGRRPEHRPDLRPRLPAGRPRLQDLGRAVPHVDARRLRGRADAGHGLLRRRAEGRGDGAARCAWRSAPSPAIGPQWQQIVSVARHRLDGARRLRRHRPDQHQAADGLFVDRQHRLSR